MRVEPPDSTMALFLLSVLVFLAGVGILSAAQSAIHEIDAFILFLICAVLLVGAAIVQAINIARKRIESLLNKGVGSLAPPDSAPASQPAVGVIDWEKVAEVQQEQQAEKSAAQMFAEAKQLAESGQRREAAAVLREIARRFPDTDAARKARRSFEKSGVELCGTRALNAASSQGTSGGCPAAGWSNRERRKRAGSSQQRSVEVVRVHINRTRKGTDRADAF